MDNIKKLIVGGCSFTAGDELSDWKGHQKNVGIIRPRSEKTWANNLQKILFRSAKLDNLAISGSGYGSIVRRVIYQTERNLKLYKPEEIVVCVMWTSILRLEFPTIYPNGHKQKFLDDEDKFIFTLPYDGDGSTKWYANEKARLERRQKLANEHLVRTIVEFYTRRATVDNHIYYPLQQLEYLTSYLQSKGVKYYYTTAFNDLMTLSHRQPNIYYDDMLNRLNLPRLIHVENDMGFWEYAKANNYECAAKADHPLEAAHVKWANLFKKWILTREE